ncbi:MAG: hypothetical protein IKV02_06300 [Clostridia bacterium]|nr:hypothetical protein [Clostridia bacterium]
MIFAVFAVKNSKQPLPPTHLLKPLAKRIQIAPIGLRNAIRVTRNLNGIGIGLVIELRNLSN